MIIRLPYPPSNNRYYRNYGGRTVLSEHGREYRMDVQDLCREFKKLVGRLSMQIEVYPNRGVGQDLDNIPKAVCDALQKAGIYDNDNQIDELTIIRKGKSPIAHLIVNLREMA